MHLFVTIDFHLFSVILSYTHLLPNFQISVTSSTINLFAENTGIGLNFVNPPLAH